MWRLFGATSALFVLGVYAGLVLPVPNTISAVQGETTHSYPYLNSVSYTQLPQADAAPTAVASVIENQQALDARFAGMLVHVRWLLERRGGTAVETELNRLDKQILSVMDDVSDDISDLRDDIDDAGGLPSGFVIDNTGTVTAGVWQGTPILDAYINDVLTIGTGSSFANDVVTPNSLLSSGQVDEYCLTYEGTGTTFEWEMCGGGTGLTSTDIDTSSEVAAIVGDETGTGALVFGTSPTLVTPNLGTPSTLVGTNITGTAAGLTAGTVTTNANLSGVITSVGNTTSLGSFTSSNLLTALTDETGTGSAVFSASPTFTGTVNAAAATLSSALTLSGTAANIALGSNWLSGDGGDEGILIDNFGNVSITHTGEDESVSAPTLSITKINSTPSSEGAITALSSGMFVSPTANAQGGISGSFITFSQTGNDFNIYKLTGTESRVQHYGGGEVGLAHGFYGGVINNSGGVMQAAYGIEVDAQNSSSAGVINDLKFFSTTNFYNEGTVGNTYGLYLGDLTSGTQTNQAYSIYASDANTRNYFAGNVGIGTTSPYAKLSVTGNSAFTGQLNLSGTAANIALGSNYLSGDGDDEGIFVDTDGDVGIGTSALNSSKFIVNGSTAQIMRLTSSAVAGWIDFYENSSQRGIIGYGDSGNIFTGAISDSLSIYGFTGLHMGTVSRPSITVAASGYVGIGDTTPTSLFTVGDVISGDGDYFQINNSGVIVSSNNITPNSILSAGQADEECLTYEATGTTFEWQTCASASLFADGGITTYLISNDNVAIGTTTANQKLTIEGNINLSAAAGAIYFNDTRFIYASTTNSSVSFGDLAGNDFIASSIGNVAIGYQAARNASSTVSTVYNNFIGAWAGQYSRGEYNNMMGASAGYESFGTNNNIFGEGAGYENKGSHNNIFGSYTGDANLGSYNNFIGYQAGSLNTGDNNIAIGSRAGQSASSSYSSWNIYIGNFAGANDMGRYNTILGLQAGEFNTGDAVVLVGDSAGRYNTAPDVVMLGRDAGSQNSGLYSNILGLEAGLGNTGNYNNIFGANAGFSNTGANNNLFGRRAGEDNTGNDNNILGLDAGNENTGASNNLFGNSAGYNNSGQGNNFFGYGAGYDNAGSFNNYIGDNAGDGSTGSYNNAIGYNAGANNYSNYSDFIGFQAGRYANSTSTVAIGGGSLAGTTYYNAANNVVLGYRAGYTAATGADNNILIGYQAADNLTTGNNNIIIGYDIDNVTATADNRLNIGNLIFGTGLDGTGTTFSSGNVGIGTGTPNQKLTIQGNINLSAAAGAIYFNDTKYLYASSTNDSIVFGENAGATFSSGNTMNVAIGFEAGRYASTTGADESIYIGNQAGYNNTGWSNIFLGRAAGYNGTGYSNFFIGDHAGYNSVGNDNVFIGQDAGRENLGESGVFIGYSAGANNTGLYNNNFFGYSAGYDNTGDENNFFGQNAGYSNDGDGVNAFGELAGYNNSGSYNNFFGRYAGYSNTGNFNEMIGYQTGQNLRSTSTVAIGAEALFGTSGAYSSLNNVALGYRAGYASANGSGNNILIGYQAADNLTTGNNNIIIGYDIDNVTATTDNSLNIGNLIFGTGLDGTGTTLSSGNVGIGVSNPSSRLDIRAGGSDTATLTLRDSGGNISLQLYSSTSTLFNTYVGYGAATSTTNGNRNSAFGYQAGTGVMGGDENTFLGYQAGVGAEFAGYSTFVGARAGTIAASSFANTYIGGYAGELAEGSRNTFVGYYAGNYNQTGNYSTALGYSAGDGSLGSFTSSIAIGYETRNTADRQLVIGNSDGGGSITDIYLGEAVTDNTATSVTINPTGGSGTNNSGASLIFAGGKSTGSAAGGSLVFQTSDAGSSGTTLQSLTTKMTITAAGNMGIGTTTPLQKLQVFGDIRVGTTGSNGCIEDYGGGVIGGTCSSDERLKENIESLASSTPRSYLEALVSLTPVTYTWNEEAAERYGKSMNVANLGLIAQDVEDSFPELVTRNDDNFRQVDFRALPFYLIEAMKELWVKVRGIDERVEDLERENEYLKSRLDEIEDEINIAPPPPVEPVPEVDPVIDTVSAPEPAPQPEEAPAPEPEPILGPESAPEEGI